MTWARSVFAGTLALAVIAVFSAAAAAATAFQVSNGTYTVTSAGTDIYGSADSFVYAYAPASGDGTWIAKVDSLQNPVTWTKAGLMIRANLTAGSPMLFLMNGYQNGDWLVDRTTQGGQVNTVNGGMGVGAPVWLKIQKKGGQFFVFDSGNGTLWNLVGTPVSLNLGSNYYVGLAVSEHDPKAVGSVTFSNLTGFTPTAGTGIGVSGITPVSAPSSTPTTTTPATTAPATTTTTPATTTATTTTPSGSTATASSQQLPKTGFPVALGSLGGMLLAATGLLLVRPRRQRAGHAA